MMLDSVCLQVLPQKYDKLRESKSVFENFQHDFRVAGHRIAETNKTHITDWQRKEWALEGGGVSELLDFHKCGEDSSWQTYNHHSRSQNDFCRFCCAKSAKATTLQKLNYEE